MILDVYVTMCIRWWGECYECFKRVNILLAQKDIDKQKWVIATTIQP